MLKSGSVAVPVSVIVSALPVSVISILVIVPPEFVGVTQVPSPRKNVLFEPPLGT